MMMQHPIKDVFSITFQERLLSLLECRYMIRVRTQSDNLWYVRLKHMANGNEVVLKGYPKTRHLEQYTNHILVHSEDFT